jgi:hypothetical protein
LGDGGSAQARTIGANPAAERGGVREETMIRTFGRSGAVGAMAAVACGVVVLGLSAGPVSANQPAFHFEEDVAGDTFVCESTSYTVTSGSIKFVGHEGESESGNTNFTFTLTPQNVVAEDPAGNVYKIAGAFWVGGTTNAQTGSEQFTLTDKFQVVERGGGSVDSVNATFHINEVDGEVTNIKDFDFGTCASPED